MAQGFSPASGAAAVTPAVVNALIGAANDAEAWVRIAAVRALGFVAAEARVTSAIAAHLVDSSRVVRVSAAEALMNQGVATLEGVAGIALAAAQEEWATRLRTFNDDANAQTALGWLDLQRGRLESATTALLAAATLDGTDPRPHVYLGIIAARAQRFDEALGHFRTAKALSPTYPNIDRLIDEVQKRR